MEGKKNILLTQVTRKKLLVNRASAYYYEKVWPVSSRKSQLGGRVIYKYPRKSLKIM